MKITRDESSDQDVRRNQEHGYSGISPIKVYMWYIIITAHLGFSRPSLSNKSIIDFPISYSDVVKSRADYIIWIYNSLYHKLHHFDEISSFRSFFGCFVHVIDDNHNIINAVVHPFTLQ